MEMTTFIRKPFAVEGIEITEENIEEIANEIQIGALMTDGNGVRYILVDRRLVPNVNRVYPGYWVTKMGNYVRCWSPKIFNQQFMEPTDEVLNWVTYIEENEKSPSK